MDLCPRCQEPFDEGTLLWSGSSYCAYLSDKQTGTFRTGTKITSARACAKCGLVEMYLNPEELRRKLPRVP